MTSAEAVALLPGVTIRTLQRWADSGKVPSATLPSGRRRFRRADIEALLEVSRSAS
ncbi:helix-turn-helix domain-containing protein [Cellulomonas sp. APG4]|nr:helix-turn-helix domain-containing protein [Cellulomonas sp. APG4]